MTEPLTPPGCDLTDFPCVPLDVALVRRSKTWIRAKHEPLIGIAFVVLIAEAWHQVPAASISGDERALCALAGLHWRTWRRIGPTVLLEWTLCSDGRYYLPYLAERALSAWAAKQARMRKVIRRIEIESGEWAALRASVFERDNYTCTYCGVHGVPLECDHVVPVRLGGETCKGNLTTACKTCNRSKGSKPLLVWRREA